MYGHIIKCFSVSCILIFGQIDAVNDEPKSFIFASKEEFDETDEVLVLIHGSGAVRAGQWSRKLITNDCLDSGTQLPFIKRAKKVTLLMSSTLTG